MAQPNRYKTMERYMTCALVTDLLLFILYMIFAGIIWLKVILSILVILVSGLCIAYLYMTGELKKPRSLWMGTAAIAIVVCLIVSLLLNFP